MRRWWWLVPLVLVGCAGPPPPAPQHRATPASYLLGIDQLVSPDFVSDVPAHALTGEAVAAAAGTAPALLDAAAFTGAAAEDFVRDVAGVAIANGPVQVTDMVEEFRTAGGSGGVYSADVARLDATQGSAAVSTGSLGDAAHATTRSATTADGTVLAEVTVEWRVGNLLDVLVVRGRYGGVRPDDALLLAHRQTVAELGLARTVPTGG